MLSYRMQQFRFSKLLPDFQACLDGMQACSGVVADGLDLQRHNHGAHRREPVELSGQPTPGTVLPGHCRSAGFTRSGRFAGLSCALKLA